jgi:transposase-like protein
MAQTFRKSKIENYVQKLRVRKAVLKNQLEQVEFSDNKESILGKLMATDLIMEELKAEFNVRTIDDKPECPNCKGEESPYSVEEIKNNTWRCHECHTEWND